MWLCPLYWRALSLHDISCMGVADKEKGLSLCNATSSGDKANSQGLGKSPSIHSQEGLSQAHQ